MGQAKRIFQVAIMSSVMVCAATASMDTPVSNTLINEKKHSEAYVWLERTGGADVNRLIKESIDEFHSGNYTKALDYANLACQVDPESTMAWTSRSIYLLHLGRNADALKSSQIAIDKDPECAIAWAAKGSIQYSLGNIGDAEGSIEKAKELDESLSDLLHTKDSLEQTLEISTENSLGTVKSQILPAIPPIAIALGEIILGAVTVVVAEKAIAECWPDDEEYPVYNGKNVVVINCPNCSLYNVTG